jgi:hypothetical protein
VYNCVCGGLWKDLRRTIALSVLSERTTAPEKLKITRKLIVCLVVCFESHEQFFSYLATVTITGDGAANHAYGFQQ